MKKLLEKATKVFLRAVVPVCSMVVCLCIFVANSSPNLCNWIWGYEISLPKAIKDKC